MSDVKYGSALLSFKQPKTMFLLTNTKHMGLLDVQNGRLSGCPRRWGCTEHNVSLGRADTEERKDQENCMGRREKQFSDILAAFGGFTYAANLYILPHPDSPSSLYHLGSLAFILPHSPALVLSHGQCSAPVSEEGELSRKVNTSPLQLAALRAGLLHISNSEQGLNSPVSYGCHCALSMWHTEQILNDRTRVKREILARQMTKVLILLCNKPQDCTLRCRSIHWHF